MKRRSLFAPLALAVASLPMAALAAPQDTARIERQVRKELVTLPFYSVFDNFQFRVDGGTVTLMGDVTRPRLQRGAERVVTRIEGVTKVDNQINLLPVSPNDDRVRTATFRAIYYHPMLTRYAIQAIPPIHIIVENGDVTLEGVVNTEGEKNAAGIQANGVAGAFSVTNNLQVERD
jgi:hyperosmotically inducible protein